MSNIQNISIQKVESKWELYQNGILTAETADIKVIKKLAKLAIDNDLE